MAIITSTRESGEHERIAVRIPAAAKMIGISRSRFYELLGAGRIEAVKLGRSTLIPVASRKAFIEALASGGDDLGRDSSSSRGPIGLQHLEP